MTMPPVTCEEMAGFVQQTVNQRFPSIADEPHGNQFELVAPATGQRFRVTVEHADGWDEHLDAGLAQVRDGA